MRRRIPKPLFRVLEALASLRLMISATVFLILLIVVCTLDQVNIGTFNAVDKYFRTFFLWADVPGLGRAPIAPGGGAAGLALLLSVSAAMLVRLRWEKRKAGIWITHIGLVVLIASEFVTGMFAVESQMAIEEGASVNYSTEPRGDELVLIDHSDAAADAVYAVDASRLKDGKTLRHERWPFALTVSRFFPNAAVGRRPEGAALAPSMADRGFGPQLVLRPLPPVSQDDARNMPAAFIAAAADGAAMGTWLVSSELAEGQPFEAGGRTWSLSMRPTRHYVPFTIKLKDFTHDRYAGTEIPKNFSSLIRLIDPERGEDRDALIYMNTPLRYGGLTFYQASFGKADSLSVLQVVRNPGWLIPYFACALMGLGLLLQFLIQLRAFKPAHEGAP